jgi:hypothetical protein
VFNIVAPPPAVAARHVFYNDSAFDGRDRAADARDDAALATDKQALLPGQSPSFANVTGYARGINGLFLDVSGFPAEPTAEDFAFATGRTGASSGWDPAPAPLLSVRRGAGVGGSDRVTFTWNDNAIRNTWLRVTVKSTARTGLPAEDVSYFGHLAGDAGGRGASGAVASIDALDLLRTRRAASPTASITSPHDHNRDGRVSPADYAIARGNLNRRLVAFTAPAPPPVAPVLTRADSSDEEGADAGAALL